MRKARRKWLSILVVLAFAASLVPLAQPAQAASSYQMSYVAEVKAPFTGAIGKLNISMDGVSARDAVGSEVVLSLPSSPRDYELFPGMTEQQIANSITGTNYFNTSTTAPTTPTAPSYVLPAPITVEGQGKDTIQNGAFSVPVTLTGVDQDLQGTLELTVSGSGFPAGGSVSGTLGPNVGAKATVGTNEYVATYVNPALAPASGSKTYNVVAGTAPGTFELQDASTTPATTVAVSFDGKTFYEYDATSNTVDTNTVYLTFGTALADGATVEVTSVAKLGDGTYFVVYNSATNKYELRQSSPTGSTVAISSDGRTFQDASASYVTVLTLDNRVVSGTNVTVAYGIVTATQPNWTNYAVEVAVNGSVTAVSNGKYVGQATVGVTVKDTSTTPATQKAAFSGTVYFAKTGAQALALQSSPAPDPAASVASVQATVTANTVTAGQPAPSGVASFRVERLSATSVKLVVEAVNSAGDVDKASLISIPLVVAIPSGVSGDVTLTVEAPAGSQFSAGSVVIARVSTKKVNLAVEHVPVISAAGGKIGVIDLKEVVAGSLSADNTATLTLPKGFTWVDGLVHQVVWGDIGDIGYSLGKEGRELKIWAATRSTQASFVKLFLSVNVNEAQAATGDVKVEVSGASPSELVVARYGDYGVKVESVSTGTVLAGKASQTIGKLALKEVIPASLVAERTITLTLPDKAKWVELPKVDEDNSQLYGLELTKFYRLDDQTVKATVVKPSSVDPARVVIKGGKVTVAADFSGDLELTVGGSAGASGKVKVAEVKAPVTITVSNTPEVIIGEQNQAGPEEIVLTEVKEEALEEKSELALILPSGVTFAATPTFEVKEGDVVLGAFKMGEDRRAASVEIKSSSTKPSAIKVSNLVFTLDRTVPVGDLQVKVGGSAVVENESDFGVDYVAKATVAKCVTPAPPERKVTATFKIGNTTYTVEGVEKTMDLAPFIEGDRTYIPMRYAAYAVGVSEDAILWDGATRTATFIKGDRVVQLAANSKNMLVNGASITMDVPAKVVGGRMVVPIRWVGIAFGCAVDWDADTQTVTITR